MEFDDHALYRLLKTIQIPPSQEYIYAALWHLVLSFFDDVKATGKLSIAIIDRSGSIIQQSQIVGSDLDVPVVLNPTTTPPPAHLVALTSLARSKFHPGYITQAPYTPKGLVSFGVKSVGSSKKAVHVDFDSPFPCGVDIVPMTEAHYRKEMERVQRYRELTSLQRDAAKIVKYAVKNFSPGDVASYEIVAAALECKKATLSNCVNHLVRCFSDRLDVVGVLRAVQNRIDDLGT